MPGKIESIADGPLRMGIVSFEGVRREVCLSCVPEATVGDYVIVHAGFAISRIDAGEAREVFRTLEAMGELSELEPAEGEDEASP